MSESPREVVDVMEYLRILNSRKIFIALMTGMVAVASVIISLLLPKIYTATAKILPPQQDQLMAMAGGEVGALARLATGLVGGSTSSDIYAGILRSNNIRDSIIDRFHLMNVYGIETRVDMYRKLDKLVAIEIGKKDGIVAVTVEDKDPKRAADIANGCVEELSRMLVRLNVTGSGSSRTFLGQRLAEAKASLVKAEDALKTFQSKSQTIDVVEQAKASISGIARLKSQLALQEVNLRTLRESMTDSSPEVINARAAVAGLRTEIARMEGSSRGGAIPAFGSVPTLAQEHLRLMREFRIQEAMVETLTKQYEVARISEAQNYSSLQIIQDARPADKKAKPKRSLIVLAATFIALIFSILVSFYQEHVVRQSLSERQGVV